MKMLKVLAIGVTVGGMALAIHTEKAEATEWTPRSVEQIKADIAKTDGKEYTIVTGDTLSGIGEATNMTVKALAERNSIANVDLIYAGNKLVFEGNVVTVQNPQGETIAQSVVKDEDKIDPSQPIGQAPTTGSNNNQGSQVVTPPAVGDNGSTGGGNTVTPPTGADNGSTGGGGTVTPPATGDNGSTGGGNTVTPPTGGDNGSTGGGNETTPEQPKPEEPTRVTPLGNSGMEFNTIDEANEWGMAELMNPDSVWQEYTGFVTKPLMWSDGLVRSYSVDFYN
ncbi:LysM peptidoglycan-binding domain-containing protein [Enterococcus mundtii]|uniref:LysM peptidoglycan-binding domain-containing protein n=1 Tax=Enterococcus mundtii TaxID=53346 RepID=A0A848MVN2_ENTMU|nr:LysM domain-containing protein [Enterococcus mundtii]NMP59636.1 LysM peptidoglycan-binding domain-containing protein [Enterococcus mundtii]